MFSPQRPGHHMTTRVVMSLSALGASLLVLTSPAHARQAYDTETNVSADLPSVHRVHRVSGDGEVPPTSLRITQANLKNGMAVDKFQSDVSTILAQAPDFVTYNEVPMRQDVVLAPPPGYALWRTPGQYEGETPVAYRTDRWTPIADGTTMLSNQKGRLPGQKLDWGIRYANWLTVQDAYGHQVSVVSAHLTPVTTITTEALQQKEIVNLGNLVDTLGAAGPVLVGGDFNMNYQTPEYFGSLFAQYGMVPSYDALGTKFPTGDHRGATIDYVMLHQDPAAPALAFLDHYPTELNSDHDSVTADLSFTSVPTVPPYELPRGTSVNEPDGTAAERRAALAIIVQAIDHAPAKGAIHITAKRLSSPYVAAAINRALDRGVHVQAIFRARTITPAMQRLEQTLGQKQWRKNFALTCSTECRQINPPKAPTQLLISDVAGTTAVKITSDHGLTVGSAHTVTTVQVVARQGAYDRAFQRFFRMAGHKI
jgi:endonuclease/exonuclease/phosphatase family metal-dependent hydrolase